LPNYVHGVREVDSLLEDERTAKRHFGGEGSKRGRKTLAPNKR